MNGMSKPVPSLFGIQYPGAIPWGTKQPTNRGFGLAAVCANAVAAGTMASRNGSASAAPAPRRTVRRGMCFLVINMVDASLLYSEFLRDIYYKVASHLWSTRMDFPPGPHRVMLGTITLEQEGWLRHQENGPVPYWRRRGGHFRSQTVSTTDHPVRANFGGLRHHFLNGASTPPLQGGEYVLVQHSSPVDGPQLSSYSSGTGRSSRYPTRAKRTGICWLPSPARWIEPAAYPGTPHRGPGRR